MADELKTAPIPGSEQQEGEMKPARHTRNDLRTRMSKKYPDKNFDNDEDLDDALYNEYDAYDSESKKLSEENARYKQDHDALSDMFAQNPASASFFDAIRNGEDPLFSLVGLYGVDDIREMLDSPEKKKELTEAHQKYLEDAAKEKSLEEEYNKNIDATLDAEADAVENGEITEEELNKAHESLKRKFEMILNGKWTIDDLKAELRGLNYDTDVRQAAEDGEVRGRNAKIVEKKRSRQQGDGMPNMQMGGGNKGLTQQGGMDLGALGRTKRSIWD